MMKTRYWSYGILVLIIVCIIFIGGYVHIKYEPAENKTQNQTGVQKELEMKNENSRFGFLGVYPDYKNEFDYPEMSKIGVGWIRIIFGDAAFVWGNIEKTPGTYDFSLQDEFVKDMQEHGFNIYPVIWVYAEWDQKQCHQDECYANEGDVLIDSLGISRCNPCDKEAYKKFIKALVERYDGDGVNDMPGLRYPIKYWELLNELTMKNVAGGKITEGVETYYRGTPEDYIELTGITYDAMKEADPEANIVLAPLNKMQDSETIAFYKRVFEDGARFDIGNVHANQEQMNTGDLFAGKFEEFLHEYYPDKPYWIGEVEIGAENARIVGGFDVEGCKKKNSGDYEKLQECVKKGEEFPQKVEYDEEEQASVLVKEYVRAFAKGAEKIFYNIWYTNQGNSIDFTVAAMIRTDHTKKPVYYAFKTLINKIDYFTSVERLDNGRYKFIVGDKLVYVLWGRGSIPSEIKNRVKLTDLYGNEKIVDASEIEITNSPIFVEPME